MKAHTPPQAIEMEGAVLSALLCDRMAYVTIADILAPDDFYVPANQYIYRAIQTLFQKGNPVDMLTVAQEVKSQGNIEKAGGAAYIADLTTRVASAANIEAHARIVREKSMLRGALTLGQRLIEAAMKDTTDALNLVGDAQNKLLDIAGNGGLKFVQAGDAAAEAIKAAEAAYLHTGSVWGTPTGIRAYDAVRGGRKPGDLDIIAGRPGMGKTSLAICDALHAAQSGKRVLFFSLEMGAHQLANRILAILTGINSANIANGKLTEDDFRRLVEAAETMYKLPLHIDDTPGVCPMQIRAACKRKAIEGEIGLIVVDYLGLIQPDAEKRGRSKDQEVGEITGALKRLAREISAPVVVLAQLSRKVEDRGGSKRPQLSDLRDSGNIEQDADAVTFVYRPEYYQILEDENGYSTRGKAELIVAKNRNGKPDIAYVGFNDSTTRFMDASDYDKLTGNTPAPATTQFPVTINRQEPDAPF